MRRSMQAGWRTVRRWWHATYSTNDSLPSPRLITGHGLPVRAIQMASLAIGESIFTMNAQAVLCPGSSRSKDVLHVVRLRHVLLSMMASLPTTQHAPRVVYLKCLPLWQKAPAKLASSKRCRSNFARHRSLTMSSSWTVVWHRREFKSSSTNLLDSSRCNHGRSRTC